MRIRRPAAVLSLAAFLALGPVAAGASPSAGLSAPAPPNGELLLREAWQAVKRGFYDKNLHGVDWDAAFEKYRDQARDARTTEEAHLAINRMLGELRASHTVLMERDTWELLDAELRGEDVLQTGVQVEWRDSGFFVRTMFEKGPGDKAGLKIGDRIVSLDGEPPENSDRLVPAVHDVRFVGEPIFFIVADGTTPGSVLGAVFKGLSDGSVLMIGGRDVRVGKNVKLEGNGVPPDVLVEERFADYANGVDPILETGLDVVVEKCRARERARRGRATRSALSDAIVTAHAAVAPF